MARYTAIITPEPDGSAYNVSVPALPGCRTWGTTIEEAIEQARDAIAGHIAALAQAGLPVPVEAAPPSLVTLDITPAA